MMSTIMVFFIFIAATITGFILTGIITNNIWIAFIGSFMFQICTASIIWRIEFKTWNPFK